LGITKAEKPQSPKSKFKSVTPKKSLFLFSTSDLPRAINKIAGQQWHGTISEGQPAQFHNFTGHIGELAAHGA
jgi:hypothetical protein